MNKRKFILHYPIHRPAEIDLSSSPSSLAASRHSLRSFLLSLPLPIHAYDLGEKHRQLFQLRGKAGLDHRSTAFLGQDATEKQHGIRRCPNKLNEQPNTSTAAATSVSEKGTGHAIRARWPHRQGKASPEADQFPGSGGLQQPGSMVLSPVAAPVSAAYAGFLQVLAVSAHGLLRAKCEGLRLLCLATPCEHVLERQTKLQHRRCSGSA